MLPAGHISAWAAVLTSAAGPSTDVEAALIDVPATGISRSALHAQYIATDATDALTTSANLTDRALSTNLEVGVVLRDPVVTERLVQHFAALMQPTFGVLERLPPNH